MALNFTTFFTKFGHAVYSAKNLLQNTGPDQDTVIQSFVNDFDSESLDVKNTIDGLIPNFRQSQAQARQAVSNVIVTPMRAFMTQEVKEDLGKSVSFNEAITEFLDQLDATGNTVESSTTSSSVTAGGGNVGDGQLFISTKFYDGTDSQLLIDEDLLLTCTTVDQDGNRTFTGKGDEAYAKLDGNYPGGTGRSYSITQYRLDNSNVDNLLFTSNFSTADAYATSQPASWIAYDADATGSLTNYVTQDIEITNSPTGGYYNIVLYEKGGTKQLVSENISYAANGASVQASLRKLPGYSEVTVTSTGTSPNFTHTITFVGTEYAYAAVVREFLTGGSGAPYSVVSALVTDGEFRTAGRSLKIDGDGSEQTDYYQKIELSKDTVYFAHALIKETATITSGTLNLSLVDSPAGTVLQDRQGNNNTGSVTLSSLSAGWNHFGVFFRTNNDLPESVYLRLNCATAIDASGTLCVDTVRLLPAAQFYNGGPYYCLFEGDTNFELNDTFTIAVNNNYSGEIQQWFDRIYDVRNFRRQLPHSGSPTYADTLITAS
ncbi:MAG: hypothetical protein VXW76_00880 [Actinomycetota bacterium]|nr:hypothetical protein [Actinomycetota bacterium]